MPMDQTIAVQSAGSVAVAAIALLFCLFQYWCFRKQTAEEWNAWGAGLSLSTFVYASAVVVQYNTPPGALNLFCERVQYTAIVVMLHAAQGFTFSFLAIALPRRRAWALIVTHSLILILIWATPWVIRGQFVARRFSWMARPYHEPVLAALGLVFIAYAALMILGLLATWIRYRRRAGGAAPFFLVGLSFWAVLAVNDAAATLGARTVLFLMEYGFLGFSAAVLLATARRALDLENDLILEKERLGATILSMGEGFVSTDPAGHVVMYNKAAARLCGWEREKIIGCSLDSVYRVRRSGKASPWSDLLASVTREGGPPRSAEVVLEPLNDKARRLIETVTPIFDTRGRITGMVILFRAAGSEAGTGHVHEIGI